ncbi:helix-turn-helix domain-containing protein [Streptomyces phaeochromogenes]
MRELHAAGNSRNDIARAIKRSPSTVSKIAGSFEPPLTFDRAAEVAAETAVATRTSPADAPSSCTTTPSGYARSSGNRPSTASSPAKTGSDNRSTSTNRALPTSARSSAPPRPPFSSPYASPQSRAARAPSRCAACWARSARP